MEYSKRIFAQDQSTQREIREYFNHNVKPIYSNLITNIIKAKPQDILDYCTKWFKDRKGDFNREDKDDSDDEEDMITFQTVSDQVWKEIKGEKLQRARKRRIGLASQKNDRRSIKVFNGQKKQEQTHMRILFFCMNSFLFKNFTEKQIDDLINKMKKVEVNNGDQICKQGQYGDKMYFVDYGTFNCIQQTQQGYRTLKQYSLGDTFGEICLLHKIKRQATIVAASYGILYSLDRQSYITFKKMCMIKKRTLYICTLSKRAEFANFSQDQIQKISDVLVEVTYEQGELVINEGDVGTRFYIVLDGILVAFTSKNNGNVNLFYKEGDLFGEVALVKDKPRQASVKALTRCKLVYLTREVFRRIFEKNPNIEKQIDQKYAAKSKMIVNKRRVQNHEEGKNQKPHTYARRTSVKPQRQSQNALPYA